MKSMFKQVMSGVNGRMNVLTLLVLSTVLAMVLVFVTIGSQVEAGKARVAAAKEQQVLSKDLGAYTQKSARGDIDALRRLEETTERFTEIVESQRADFGSGPESIALQDLENSWRGVRQNINELLDRQPLLGRAGEAAGDINEAIPQLLKQTDKLIDLLMEAGGSAEQVRLASQQLVLVQRIRDSLDGSFGANDAKPAIVALAEDTLEFGRVLDGFIRGGGGIRALQGTSLKSQLGKIAVPFGKVSKSVASIAASSEELVLVQSAASEIIAQSGALFDASKNLDKVLTAMPGNRFIRKELAYALGVIALVLLCLRAFEQYSRRRQLEQENARNQDAIKRLLDEMGDLAEGDLTVHTTVGGDFTGSIADSINVTVDSLRGLVKTINDTSTQLSASVQETEDIAANLLAASLNQSRGITDASTAVNAMSVSMNNVSSNADESSRVAMRSVEVARNGGEAVQRTMNGMDTIREHIQETSKRIKRLGESSQEIGDIVELINDIAEQTNILALNASIQAAMAGEAGRGFAVVADEVQRLAERSANATRQIEALVKTIQADTNEAVISMEKSTAGVVNGAKLAEDASKSLGEIEDISGQLAGLIQNISNSSRDQAEAASDLTATIQGIQEVTSHATSGTEQTSRSIGNLSRLAHDLDTSVAGFKLP